MASPIPEYVTGNIFLAIDYYLAQPTKESESLIKELSNSLSDRAYEAAKALHPQKDKIGADEYQPELLKLIEEEAAAAFNLSVRLDFNSKYKAETDIHDRKYIFRLSQEQQARIAVIKNDMLSEAAATQLKPDGLIFAYAGYIERYSKDNPSLFNYCDDFDATVLDHSAKLIIKMKELESRGFNQAGQVIRETCSKIFEEQKSKITVQEKAKNIAGILENASVNQVLQEHRGEVKQLVVNFLIALTGVGLLVLLGTAYARNSFWYRTNTDTENKIEDFQNDLKISG